MRINRLSEWRQLIDTDRVPGIPVISDHSHNERVNLKHLLSLCHRQRSPSNLKGSSLDGITKKPAQKIHSRYKMHILRYKTAHRNCNKHKKLKIGKTPGRITKASARGIWSSGGRFDSIKNIARVVEPVKYYFASGPGAGSGKRQSSPEHTDVYSRFSLFGRQTSE